MRAFHHILSSSVVLSILNRYLSSCSDFVQEYPIPIFLLSTGASLWEELSACWWYHSEITTSFCLYRRFLLLGSCGLKFFFVFHIYFSIQKFALMRMLSFPQMYISLVSLSIDGKFMCTVDVKLPEEELGGLVTLKFWNQGSRAGQYFLSTVIYEPHRYQHDYIRSIINGCICSLTILSYSDAGISAIAFRPGKNMAVSSSFGGNFKVCISIGYWDDALRIYFLIFTVLPVGLGPKYAFTTKWWKKSIWLEMPIRRLIQVSWLC